MMEGRRTRLARPGGDQGYCLKGFAFACSPQPLAPSPPLANRYISFPNRHDFFRSSLCFPACRSLYFVAANPVRRQMETVLANTGQLLWLRTGRHDTQGIVLFTHGGQVDLFYVSGSRG